MALRDWAVNINRKERKSIPAIRENLSLACEEGGSLSHVECKTSWCQCKCHHERSQQKVVSTVCGYNQHSTCHHYLCSCTCHLKNWGRMSFSCRHNHHGNCADLSGKCDCVCHDEHITEDQSQDALDTLADSLKGREPYVSHD